MNINLAKSLHTLSRVLSLYSEMQWEKDGFKEIKIGHLQPLLELTKGDYSNNQLAEKSGMTKQSMSRLIKELVELGYIKITKNEGDARVFNLKLSPKGKGFITYLEGKNLELDGILIPSMGMEAFDRFKTSIDTLLSYLQGLDMSQ